MSVCAWLLVQLSQHAPEEPHLSEGALADERVNFVAVEPLLPVLHYVVVVVVVVAVVVNFPLFFGARVLRGNLLRTSLLLSVVHLQEAGTQRGVGLQRGVWLQRGKQYSSYLVKHQH